MTIIDCSLIHTQRRKWKNNSANFSISIILLGTLWIDTIHHLSSVIDILMRVCNAGKGDTIPITPPSHAFQSMTLLAVRTAPSAARPSSFSRGSRPLLPLLPRVYCPSHVPADLKHRNRDDIFSSIKQSLLSRNDSNSHWIFYFSLFLLAQKEGSN